MQEELERVSKDKEEAVRSQKFEKAASLRDKEMELRKKVEKEEEKWKSKNNTSVIDITEENIAEVISTWTGIPVQKLTQDENEKLKNLEKSLHQRVVGQEEAKVSVRNNRREAIDAINKLEVSEDEKKSGENNVQDLVNTYNKKVDQVLAEKEQELLSV